MMPSSWNLDIAGQRGQGGGPAGAPGPGYFATSATNLPIGVGSTSLTTQTGLAYVVGTRVRMSSNADPTQWMEGLCTAYNSATGAMTLSVDLTSAMAAAPPGTLPTIQIFKSGSGTYTTPAGCKRLEVILVGGGGGGGGSGTAGGSVGQAGGNTTFGSATAYGAAVQGAYYQGGAGGAAPTGCTYGFAGGYGGGLPVANLSAGGSAGAFGGTNALGGAGAPQWMSGQPPPAQPNTGAGGGGAPMTNANNCGAGGGAGAYGVLYINNPAATYSYAVGAGGNGGAAGTSGFAGGNGAAGIIIVREFY